MKLRVGFVSNSSSSSFYIARPKKHIPFEEIAKYYEISPSLSEEERMWMSVCIWLTLNEKEKRLSNNYEYDEDESNDEYDGKSYLDELLEDSHIQWMQSNEYLRKPDGYWDKAKKLKDNPEGVVQFSIDTSEGFSCDGLSDWDLKLPFNFNYDMRLKAEEVFMNPEKALGIQE